MKQLLYSVLLALLLPVASMAQTDLPPILCGNEVFEHILRQNHPELLQHFDRTYQQLLASQGTKSTSRSPLTINVVVHVVWKTPEENISDALIQEQIDILNRDFNRENTDANDLRAEFKEVAGVADIRFNLAEVRRVKTSLDFKVSLTATSLLADLKSTEKGGSTAADPKKFLNIWICQIRPLSILTFSVGQILGFAFPPADLPNWPANASAPTPGEDGVVLDFRVIGQNNPVSVPLPGGGGNLVVRGRTAVHEVGHYLGLRHIWGDGGLLGLPNQCNQSDGVDDTPFANAQSKFDCDKTRNTCTGVETFYGKDMPDMVENYMDYAAETCMNTFTKGQVALMRNTLAGPRKGLVEAVTGVAGSTDQQTTWTVVPNPAHHVAFIDLTLTNPTPVQVRVFSANGQLVRNIAQDMGAGNNRIALEAASMPTGLYFVQMQTAAGVSMKKWEVVK